MTDYSITAAETRGKMILAGRAYLLADQTKFTPAHAVPRAQHGQVRGRDRRPHAGPAARIGLDRHGLGDHRGEMTGNKIGNLWYFVDIVGSKQNPSLPADGLTVFPDSGARRHHRRRRDRLLGRLSPRQARLARRRAAGAGAADLRHHLACGRPGRAVARAPEHDAAGAVFGRALPAARGRDRAGDRLEAMRLGAGRAHAGARDLVQAHRMRRRARRASPARSISIDGGGAKISGDAHRRPARRALAAARRQGQSGRRDAGARQGRAHERRAHLRADPRDRDPSEGRRRDRRRDRARRHQGRGRDQLRRPMGQGRSGGSPA